MDRGVVGVAVAVVVISFAGLAGADDPCASAPPGRLPAEGPADASNVERAEMFANGRGVKQDLAVAAVFLCRAREEMAPAEYEAMAAQLEEMRKGTAGAVLDFCSAVTSGAGMGICAARDWAAAEGQWEGRLAAVAAAVPPGVAFQELVAAARAFARKEALLAAEESRGGTIYPSLVTGAETAAMEAFVADAERWLQQQRAQPADAARLAAADAALNEVFGRQRREWVACDGCEEDERTSRQAVLRDAQRAWIRYRDAWRAAYKGRWSGAAEPAALDAEIAAALTAARTFELGKVGQEP
jgi:uncharacterized protein YecT (DUF1311 family)